MHILIRIFGPFFLYFFLSSAKTGSVGSVLPEIKLVWPYHFFTWQDDTNYSITPQNTKILYFNSKIKTSCHYNNKLQQRLDELKRLIPTNLLDAVTNIADRRADNAAPTRNRNYRDYDKPNTNDAKPTTTGSGIYLPVP